MVSLSTKDQALHLGVIGIGCEELEALFEIYGPEPQPHESVLWVTFRIHIIIMKSLNGHILDIGEGFHAFFVAFDWVLVSVPGAVLFLEGSFYSEGYLKSWDGKLCLCLHTLRLAFYFVLNYND